MSLHVKEDCLLLKKGTQSELSSYFVITITIKLINPSASVQFVFGNQQFYLRRVSV